MNIVNLILKFGLVISAIVGVIVFIDPLYLDVDEDNSLDLTVSELNDYDAYI